jgi:hypothetical protein
MSKQIKNIFSDTVCPSQEMMLKYASNLMKEEEKHAFERHLAGCIFCSEALEGLSLQTKEETMEDVAFLNKKIDGLHKNRRPVGYWPLAVAASVSILLLTGTWFYLNEDKGSALAVETPVQNKVTEMDEAEDASKPEILSKENDGYIEEEQKKNPVEVHKEEMSGSSQGPLEITSPQISANYSTEPKAAPSALSAPSVQSVQEEISLNQSGAKRDEVAEMGDRDDEKETVVIGYGTAARKKSKPVNSDSVSPVFLTNKPSQEMLAMVEAEFSSTRSITEAKKSKSSRASGNAASTPELNKDKAIDDCPNCPKKAASETAQSNLTVLSMDYAMKKYKMKKYEEAHKQFEEIIKEDKEKTQTENAKIFNALSLVNLNREEEALLIVNNIITTPFSNNINAAKWIKTSILISRKENIQAKVILEDLSRHANPYQAKAKQILATLQ